jgi:hypothetical protein
MNFSSRLGTDRVLMQDVGGIERGLAWSGLSLLRALENSEVLG